jgi:hypothetical protein
MTPALRGSNSLVVTEDYSDSALGKMRIGKIQDDDRRPSIFDESKIFVFTGLGGNCAGHVNLAVCRRLVKCLSDQAAETAASSVTKEKRPPIQRQARHFPVDLPKPCSRTFNCGDAASTSLRLAAVLDVLFQVACAR